MNILSGLNGNSRKFTITCISTGGPATTVTWTRDSITVTEGTETVLDDPVTAQYTHTLTVTGRRGGMYTCTVSNNKPSMENRSIVVAGSYSTEIKLYADETRHECHYRYPVQLDFRTIIVLVGDSKAPGA